MHIRRYSLTILLGLAAAACGGRQRAPDTAGDQPAASSAAMPAAQAQGVVGNWVLRRTDDQPQGTRLELVLDSAVGATFRARIAFLMQGNVGIDPSVFGAGRGDISTDSIVRVELGFTTPTPPARLGGPLAGDTIRLTEFVWAGEDQLRTGTPWVLVRQH